MCCRIPCRIPCKLMCCRISADPHQAQNSSNSEQSTELIFAKPLYCLPGVSYSHSLVSPPREVAKKAPRTETVSTTPEQQGRGINRKLVGAVAATLRGLTSSRSGTRRPTPCRRRTAPAGPPGWPTPGPGCPAAAPLAAAALPPPGWPRSPPCLFPVRSPYKHTFGGGICGAEGAPRSIQTLGAVCAVTGFGRLPSGDKGLVSDPGAPTPTHTPTQPPPGGGGFRGIILGRSVLGPTSPLREVANQKERIEWG